MEDLANVKRPAVGQVYNTPVGPVRYCVVVPSGITPCPLCKLLENNCCCSAPCDDNGFFADLADFYKD